MECPKCGHKAIVVDKEEYRHEAGDPLSEVRTYACMNEACLHGFQYRNSYLKPTERLNVAKFIRRYKASVSKGQSEMEFQDD